MKTLLDNPAFGIALTLLLYSFGGFVSSRVRKIRLLSFLNPFVIAVVTGMLLITLTGIPLASVSSPASTPCRSLAPSSPPASSASPVSSGSPACLGWRTGSSAP